MRRHRKQAARYFGHCLFPIIIIIPRLLRRRKIPLLIFIATIVYITILRRELLSRHGLRGGQSANVLLSALEHQSHNVCSQHKPQVYSFDSTRNETRQCNEDYCFVIVVTVNMGFYDFFINWHRHYERVVLPSSLRQSREKGVLDSTQMNNRTVDSTGVPFLVVIAEDNDIYEKLLSLPLSKDHDSTAIILGVHATRQYSKNEAADYDSPNYKSLVSVRATHLLNLVCGLPQEDPSTNGASSLDHWNKWIVVYSDIDTVWLKNPIPIIESNLFEFANTSSIGSLRSQPLRPKYEILASVDDRNYSNFETYYCTGFLVVACTPASIVFLSRWEEKLVLNPQLNQPIFNSLLQTQHVEYAAPRYGPLSEVEFPPGRLFFIEGSRNRTQVREQTVVVHNNYIIGHDSKKKRFEDYRLWMP